ncbi:hypothetical protein SGLAM104S_07698 [Streptomyces glaucescens]
MSKAVRHLRALPIRSRLALLVAAAVAFAVAAVSVTCWFLVRERLYGQLDEQLRSEQVSTGLLQLMLDNCRQADPRQLPLPPNSPIVTILYSDGSTCTNPGIESVPAQDADLAVADGEAETALHSGRTTGGTAVRVYTRPVVDRDTREVQPGIAVSVAKPLGDVTKPLNSLAWVLLAVSGIGVVGAGAAGLAVARAGLRPVDRLTEAVEHVARTEDLTIRIPVQDDDEDEIARLSRSFNSMTSALASSRDLQQQLIADAGHELRTPLTSLRTNIELLSRSEETGRPIPEADRKALLASVKAQMTELAALIGDLQELSRPDTGQHGRPDPGDPVPGGGASRPCARREAARPGADDHGGRAAVVRAGGAVRAGAGAWSTCWTTPVKFTPRRAAGSPYASRTASSPSATTPLPARPRRTPRRGVRMRLLPWTGVDGKPCYLSSDDPHSPLSRLADDIEAAQLRSAAEVLAGARAVLGDAKAGERAVRFALTRAAESLEDVLRVAVSRGARVEATVRPD